MRRLILPDFETYYKGSEFPIKLVNQDSMVLVIETPEVNPHLYSQLMFHSVRVIQCGKIMFSANSTGITEYSYGGWEGNKT